MQNSIGVWPRIASGCRSTPPEPSKATLGGIVATNACGPRRYAHGTIGDYLLGFRAVDGRGEVFSGGGRVVKNAAGYNLPRLMVGSLGTLGVITQVDVHGPPAADPFGPGDLRHAQISNRPSACWPPWAAAGRRR